MHFCMFASASGYSHLLLKVTNDVGKGGKVWPKTLHESIPERWYHSDPGDRMASDGGGRSICSMR
jgi:hypothetical protein